MTGRITIERAAVADAEILSTLSITTFRDAFGAENRKQDMDKYLRDVMGPEPIRKELNDEANYFFLARYDGKFAGYCKMRANREPDIDAVNPMELERIYVLEEFQGRKTGVALMRHCLGFAAGLHHDVLWLGVWELNYKALGFYRAWGFELCGSHPFLLGNDLQTDVLMRKGLQ